METLTVTLRGEPYEVVLEGDRDGRPVLLLHGFTGSALAWTEIAAVETRTSNADLDSQEQSPARSILWIAPSLLGHGLTAAPKSSSRYRMGEQVADLLALMDSLGHRRYSCLGYSMGGRVALALAVEHPDCLEKLVLESASPGLAEEGERSLRRESDNQLAQHIEDIGMQAFIAQWEHIPLFASQRRLPLEAWNRQRSIRLQQRAQGLANSLRGLGTGMQPSYWEALRRVTLPTLLVTGEDDGKFTGIADAMVQRMPQAQHQVVPAAGHTVHLEQTQKFREIVLPFLLA